MKVVLVHPELDHRGGAENVVLWMARSLVERGHAVSVRTRALDPDAWPEGAWKGVDLGCLPAPPRTRFLNRTMRHRWPGRHLRPETADADLLVCHNYPTTLWAEVAARRRRGLRTVWFCEEPPARLHWRRSMPRLAAAAADPERYPWLERPLREWLKGDQRPRARRRQVKDLPPEREAVRRMGRRLANSAFTAGRARAIYGSPFEPCLLGAPEPAPPRRPEARAPYVAWVTSRMIHKNAAGFLEALRIAVHEHGARDLLVRAVGLDARRFGPLLAAKGLAAHVVLEPRIDDAELAGLLAESRLVAVPPLDEPFGLVVVEAMALGRAVLASSVGGPSETVVHGETGLHAHPLDPRALAAALLELWYAPARCETLGAAGYERYRSRFTFERFMERFLERALAAGASEPARRPAVAARAPSLHAPGG